MTTRPHLLPTSERALRRIERLGGKCVICGSTKNLTIDHIVPRSKSGGMKRRCNKQVMCYPCNLYKGNRCPIVRYEE